MPNNLAYDLRPVHAPQLQGMWLRLMVMVVERPAFRDLLFPLLTRNLGLQELRAAQIDETPVMMPLYAAEESGGPTFPHNAPCHHPLNPGFHFRGIRDYQEAYQSESATPEQVAGRAIEAIAASDCPPLPLRAFVAYDADDLMSQAHKSAERWKLGRPLGPLDGVPIAVKDEIDMVPHVTTAGTRFLHSRKVSADSTVVARLRSAGALLVGKTNMHEIGILPDGLNAHHGPVRNPYEPAHDAGGSSSGSAAAVAAGLCAAAIGADAGGSIRIPASYCGVVGLKPTYGRVSEFGALPLAWSVAHIGPIAATAGDAAIIHGVIAGPDPRDPNTQAQPPVVNPRFDGSLKGVRIGIYRSWFTDAAADIVSACEKVLDEFVRLGADLVEIVIPDLRLMAVAHGLTTHAEMAASTARHDREHRRDFSLTTRLMLANARGIRATDYVQAQRMRARAMNHFRSALSKADVVATPTTPIAAPEISKHGLVDADCCMGRVFEAMRFINPANLTGLPAITIPAGYDRLGLPLGLQLTGRPWDENTLLRLALAADGIVARRPPLVWFDLLNATDASGVITFSVRQDMQDEGAGLSSHQSLRAVQLQ